MAHENGGTEEELAAANRQAENDDAGTDDAEPLEPAGRRRDGQLGNRPGREARSDLACRGLRVSGDAHRGDDMTTRMRQLSRRAARANLDQANFVDAAAGDHEIAIRSRN